MIHLHCRCGRQFKVPASQAGKSGACPECGRSIRLIAPQVDAEAADRAVSLECVAGPHHVGRQFFLAGPGPIHVGKSRAKDFQVIDEKASRSHCRFVRQGESWCVEDQNSTNGTRVNGERIESCDLAAGDEVRIGGCRFIYQPFEVPASSEPAGAVLASPVDVSPPPAPSPDDELITAEDLFAMSDDEPDVPIPMVEEDPEAVDSKDGLPEFMPLDPEPDPLGPSSTEAQPGTGVVCPGCKQVLPAFAKICIDCGIDLRTGKRLLTSNETNLDEVLARAEGVVRYISWLIWFGLYPIASEAFGTKKPYVIWGVALLTTVISLWFLVVEYSGSPQADAFAKQCLWIGQFDASEIPTRFLPEGVPVEDLGPEDFGLYRYEPSQLLTHAFLHGGIMHLAGNMLFLLVFGSRVNALIGQIPTLLVYPVLAIVAGMFQMASGADQFLCPCLGASGAVMGMAGMYLVFFPLHKVHMLFWWRLGLLFGFELKFSTFAVRGFWVVLFYIAFDVAYVLLEARDGIGHWAHLGGFIAGIVLAVVLLVSRLVNARGDDLLSAIFGRYAWVVIRHRDVEE